MAFALTLFVEAANLRITGQDQPDAAEERDNSCADLYDMFCMEREDRLPAAGRFPLRHESSLYRAFRGLCDFYEEDALQAAICARVLAFHFLMVETAGAAVEGWMRPNLEAPDLVFLHPAVVDAIATVDLSGSLQLAPEAFQMQIADLAAKGEQTQ